MKKREGVSFADLPEVLPPKANCNDIANQLGLERVPGVQIDPEKLMLDIGRMRVVSRAFGSGGIRLRRKQDEVTNDYQVDSITSISPSGVATGNASATSPDEPLGNAKLEDGHRKGALHRYSWPILNIEVGVQQIANNVAEQRELDTAFREALVRGGKDNLVWVDGFQIGLTAIQLAYFMPDAGEPYSLAKGFFGFIRVPIIGAALEGIMLTTLPREFVGGSDEPVPRGQKGLEHTTALIKYVLRDKRWSIFMGDMQPDRYAFGRAMLASGSLVTSREISAEQITE